ncbi:formyl transferase [Xylariaceae sp. FL1272]|nr:formyl transferase [Xylariaceae sp. FL1272]
MVEYKARISCLASGTGSNFKALLDNCASGRIQGEIVKLTVNRAAAGAKNYAAAANPPIPTDYFNLVKHGFHAPGEKDPERLKEARFNFGWLDARHVLIGISPRRTALLTGTVIVMSTGFLTPVAAAKVPVINLHPALPGQYDGAGAIKRAYEDFKTGNLKNNTTGIMIHYVVEEVDRGEAVLTQEIEIQEGESLEELEERIHVEEHKLIVDATASLAEKIVSERKSTSD